MLLFHIVYFIFRCESNKICPGVRKWGNTWCLSPLVGQCAPSDCSWAGHKQAGYSITLSYLEQFETDERIVLLVSLIALKAALKFVWNGIFSSWYVVACDGTFISTSKGPFVVCAHLRSCVLIESSELAEQPATMSEQMSSFVSGANNTVKSFSCWMLHCFCKLVFGCWDLTELFLHESELKWQTNSAEMSWKGRIQLWVYHYSKIWNYRYTRQP